MFKKRREEDGMPQRERSIAKWCIGRSSGRHSKREG